MSLADDLIKEALWKQARRDAGLPLNLTPDELKQRAKEEDERLETEIQAECVRHYRANGFHIVKFGASQ